MGARASNPGGKPEEKKLCFATVDPSIIWALQPIVHYARKTTPLNFLDGSVVIEPCAMGGAMIVALSAPAMAVIRDPDGRCSGPMTVDLPDKLFDACVPSRPVSMSYCGDVYECPLPEWAQPGKVWMTSAGSFVQPKMRHPMWTEDDEEFQPCLYDTIASSSHHRAGLDYRCRSGAALPWRKPLAAARGAHATSLETIVAAPEIIALFARFHGLHRRKTMSNPPVRMQRGSQGQVVITMEGQPDFIGTFVEMRAGAPEPLPAWFESYEAEPLGSA